MANTNMFINYNELPFPHVIVDGAISQECADNLSGYAHGIEEESISFKRNGESQDNMQMFNNSHGIDGCCEPYHSQIQVAMDRASRLFDEYDPTKRKWAHSLTETNRHHGNHLHPHTDDPAELQKRNGNEHPVATLKCVLYIPNNRTNYQHYGTKVYANNDRSSFIKEIDFEQCRLFMWKTCPQSFHGTDFVEGLPLRRIFYTGEYMPHQGMEAGLHWDKK